MVAEISTVRIVVALWMEGWTGKKHKEAAWIDENILYFDWNVIVKKVYQTDSNVHTNFLQFTICKLHHICI